MQRKLLIIGIVWPEPTSSAAGSRMLQLINLFLDRNFEITFASSASKSEFSFHLESLGVTEKAIKLNDESFNHFIKNLNPDVVLFDRFMIEEQYGWRVSLECPNALHVLDTEDLHFLRQVRQTGIKKGEKDLKTLNIDVTKREIASILRCDLSLIISKTEIDILQKNFKIEPSILYYLPFLEEKISEKEIKNWVPFDERKDFVFIGNFLHEPNWHTVQFLKTKIWPALRKSLPGVSLNIYGAYPSQKVLQLDNKKENFNIKGRAEDARSTISKHRLMLAPIQFGAGLKGKFIDAMQTGTPSITTSIGAEAMKGNLNWPGVIEDDIDKFVGSAVELYQNKSNWENAQKNGIEIINQLYDKNQFENNFTKHVDQLLKNLHTHREQNFYGQLLKHHSLQSTKYMSLWIEEKNKH
jgi:glycosyltransferase involved in cell wall biosynthesis